MNSLEVYRTTSVVRDECAKVLSPASKVPVSLVFRRPRFPPQLLTDVSLTERNPRIYSTPFCFLPLLLTPPQTPRLQQINSSLSFVRNLTRSILQIFIYSSRLSHRLTASEKQVPKTGFRSVCLGSINGDFYIAG